MNAGLTVIGEARLVEDFIESHPDCAGLMLVAPGEDYTPGEAWVLVKEQAAPYTCERRCQCRELEGVPSHRVMSNSRSDYIHLSGGRTTATVA